jgi:hypothetical protein
MWEPFRKQLVKAHTFYIDQAKKRLLTRFENIEEEAQAEMDTWLEQTSHLFDPERHDPGDFYEKANDVGIEFYELLTEMRERTRLSVIAGMYHEWDKQLRDWLWREISHRHRGDELKRQVWAVDFVGLMEFMISLGWDVKSTPYYVHLDACRLIVNVYKHGEGKSFEQLRDRHPNYIQYPLASISDVPWAVSQANYTHLKVSDEAVDVFSRAIIDFWNDVPENVFALTIDEVPNWFERAYKMDRED